MSSTARGPGVRLDTQSTRAYSVPPFYDSLLSQVICQGRDRQEALRRMQVALESFIIEGVTTTIPFSCCAVMANKHPGGGPGKPSSSSARPTHEGAAHAA